MADFVGRKARGRDSLKSAAVPSAREFFKKRDRSIEGLRRALRPLTPPSRGPRRVAVILSSSRGGSSFLYRMLAGHPEVYSLGGEETPFMRLWGFQWSGRWGESDALLPDGDAVAGRLGVLAGFMLARSGRLWSAPDPFPVELYAGDCAERLLFQWPERDLRFEDLMETALKLLEGRENTFNAEGFWADLLAGLRREGIVLDASRYDGAAPGDAEGLAPREPPFRILCVEEPPFVVPRPRKPLERADVEDRLFLLKTSADCYRVDFLRALFPGARFLFVHLTRNPAASLNGLIDGWLSGGFYSHPVGIAEPLDIGGYSSDEKPWTRIWWKYDLPPGWERLRRASLPELAAYQWSCAHRHALDALERVPWEDQLRLSYEELLDEARFPAALERLARFLGLDRAGLPRTASETPFVMAVKPPAPGKWKARRAEIEPLLRTPELRETASRLGYGEPWDRWP